MSIQDNLKYKIKKYFENISPSGIKMDLKKAGIDRYGSEKYNFLGECNDHSK